MTLTGGIVKAPDPRASVGADLESVREEITVAEDGETPRTRFSVPLTGAFGVEWIESFYRLQWAGTDDIGYHISKNCREIYFERSAPAESREWLPGALSSLRDFIGLVNRELTRNEGNQAA